MVTCYNNREANSRVLLFFKNRKSGAKIGAARFGVIVTLLKTAVATENWHNLHNIAHHYLTCCLISQSFHRGKLCDSRCIIPPLRGSCEYDSTISAAQWKWQGTTASLPVRKTSPYILERLLFWFYMLFFMMT